MTLLLSASLLDPTCHAEPWPEANSGLFQHPLGSRVSLRAMRISEFAFLNLRAWQSACLFSPWTSSEFRNFVLSRVVRGSSQFRFFLVYGRSFASPAYVSRLRRGSAPRENSGQARMTRKVAICSSPLPQYVMSISRLRSRVWSSAACLPRANSSGRRAARRASSATPANQQGNDEHADTPSRFSCTFNQILRRNASGRKIAHSVSDGLALFRFPFSKERGHWVGNFVFSLCLAFQTAIRASRLSIC
jgi:hypothetical protein